jgi:hypothetical protein
MTREDILDTAKATLAARGQHYGGIEDNFARIARLWSTHLMNRYGVAAPHLEPDDVALMMILLKVARLENDPSHADSWVDIAGYSACGGSISVAPPVESV